MLQSQNWLYQYVLRNQHSLLLVLASSVHHQHMPAQRSTRCNRLTTFFFVGVVASSNKTGLKVPCLPEHSIPKECSMPSTKHLGDMIWKSKPISMQQKPFIMHTHIKCENAKLRINFLFPSSKNSHIPLSTWHFSFQLFSLRTDFFQLLIDLTSSTAKITLHSDQVSLPNSFWELWGWKVSTST